MKFFNDVYPGVVTGTSDPQGKGRVRVKVPQVLGATGSTWAAPMGGVNTPPVAGDKVNVQFIGGDATRPVYSVVDQTRPWEPISAAVLSQVAAAYNPLPSAWTNLPMNSGFQYAGFGYTPAWRWLVPNLTVELRGLFGPTSGTLASNQIPITVPTTIRPLSLVYHMGPANVTSASGSVRLEVTPATGELFIRWASGLAYAPSWAGLDGFRYDLV